MIVCYMITLLLHDACLVIMFIYDIDILIISIDSFGYHSILTLLVVWLSYSSWHVYPHYFLSYSSWYVDSLGCILSWSSLSMLSLLYIHLDYFVFCFLFSLCVDMDDIYALCMIVCCMTSLLLHDACIACLYGTHIYPLTSNSLVSIDLNYSMVEISREIVIEYPDLSYCTWL